MYQSAEEAWKACLDLIESNVRPTGFRTWFLPTKGHSLEQVGEVTKLTIEVPSHFYYEWIESQYQHLLRKSVQHVLGDGGRLYYKVCVAQGDDGRAGATVNLPTQPQHPADHPQQRPIRPQDHQLPRHSSQPPSHFSAPQEDFRSSPPPQQHRPSAPRTAGYDQQPRSYSEGRNQQPQAGPNRPVGRPQRSYGAQPQRPLGDAPVGGETPRLHRKPAPPATPFALPGIERPRLEPNLNPRYQLDRFVGGDSNAVALSTAQAIADKPGNTSFNPLLLYGGVGLGKTHLMQAIGNHILQTRPELVVRYITSDDFTNEFVAAIRENKGNEFSMTYRSVDVLLVDDVQFLATREKTQDEFFHLFNKLYQDGKQIVLTSDQAPREVKGVEQRLVSRFAWGVVLEVRPPGFETRMAILQRKAEDEGLDVSPEIIEFIAHNITNTGRELEGAMIRLLARAGSVGQELTLPMAKEALRDLIQNAPTHLTIDEIMQVVSEETGVTVEQMCHKTRRSDPVRARQLAMHLCKKYTSHSLKKIGVHFGGRDHSTVIHALRKVEDTADVDPDYRATLDALERKVELRRR